MKSAIKILEDLLKNERLDCNSASYTNYLNIGYPYRSQIHSFPFPGTEEEYNYLRDNIEELIKDYPDYDITLDYWNKKDIRISKNENIQERMTRYFIPKFTGHVTEDDLNNPKVELLPLRRGCSGGACACSGACRDIIGFITREEYSKYKAKIKLAEVFWNQTTINLSNFDDERFKEEVKKYRNL